MESSNMATTARYHSVFISYSSQDQAFAQQLSTDLQAHGVHCWLATKDLKIGDKFWYRIEDAIRDYDKLLVVISEPSALSLWVEREVVAVLEKERASGVWLLLPILLDKNIKTLNTLPPWIKDTFRQRYIGDFLQWQKTDEYHQALSRLLNALQVVQ
jgi:hypothetical protein